MLLLGTASGDLSFPTWPLQLAATSSSPFSSNVCHLFPTVRSSHEYSASQQPSAALLSCSLWLSVKPTERKKTFITFSKSNWVFGFSQLKKSVHQFLHIKPGPPWLNQLRVLAQCNDLGVSPQCGCSCWNPLQPYIVKSVSSMLMAMGFHQVQYSSLPPYCWPLSYKQNILQQIKI